MSYISQMQDQLDRIKNIESKLKQVLQKMNFLKEENRTLIAENVKLKEYHNQINRVEEDNEVNRSNDNLQLESTSQKALDHIKLEIEKHIVEIDDCIELLKA